MRTFITMLTSGRLHQINSNMHAVTQPGSMFAGRLLSLRGHSSRLGSSSRSCVSMPEVSLAFTELDTQDSAPTTGDLRTVAAWRLARLQTYGTNLTDYSTAVQLKGVTFDNRQAFIQQLQPSQGVIISQEPWNKADRHAVAVLTAGMEHLGYLPRDLAQQWHSTTCFGSVAALGRAEGVGPWGVTVQCKPGLQGFSLDLLPDEWQEAADVQQALGQDWDRVQQQVLQQHRHRCAVTGMPQQQQQQQQQQPLHIVPQWHWDEDIKQVHLAQLIPVCETVYAIRQQLAAAADRLAETSPSLKLPSRLPNAISSSSGSSSSSGNGTAAGTDSEQLNGLSTEERHAAAQQHKDRVAALHTSHAQLAADAVAALPVEQQEAIKWMSILTPWPQVDCVKYVAYAGYRRQWVMQDGWRFVQPDMEQLACILQGSTRQQQYRASTAAS